jgi:hypothetical protein
VYFLHQFFYDWNLSEEELQFWSIASNINIKEEQKIRKVKYSDGKLDLKLRKNSEKELDE